MNGLWDELERRGTSRRELESLSGIDRPRPDDFSSTLSEPDLFRFFDAVASLTNDDTFGLSVGRSMSVAGLNLAGHMILASGTFREAMQLVHGSCPHGLAPVLEELTKHRVRLGFFRDQEPTAGARFKAQLFGVLMHDIVRHFLDEDSEAPVMEFGFPSPLDTSVYQQTFPGGVHFDADGTFVTFPKRGLDQRRRGSDPALIQSLVTLAQVRFGAVQATDDDWTTRARRALRAQLAPRLMEPSVLAKQLGVTPRSLWRRLTNEGTSFSILLNEALYERAQALLSRPRATCTHVAEVLGYTELSSFYRAFRRWSGGLTPSEFRRLQRVNAASARKQRQNA